MEEGKREKDEEDGEFHGRGSGTQGSRRIFPDDGIGGHERVGISLGRP
jgi:hypothetical protein